MFPYMKLFIYLTLFLLVACSKPTDPGDYRRIRYCDLNGVFYAGVMEYEKYCNPEGVKLYDSLKKDDEFVAQFEIQVECKIDTNYYSLGYNTYTGYFWLMNSTNTCFFDLKRGKYYNSDYGRYRSSASVFFSSQIRCLLKCRDAKDVIAKDIPSNTFTIDPIDVLEEATTCEEKGIVFESFLEHCRENASVN